MELTKGPLFTLLIIPSTAGLRRQLLFLKGWAYVRVGLLEV